MYARYTRPNLLFSYELTTFRRPAAQHPVPLHRTLRDPAVVLCAACLRGE